MKNKLKRERLKEMREKNLPKSLLLNDINNIISASCIAYDKVSYHQCFLYLLR